MNFAQVAVGDTIQSPLGLHDYQVLRKTRDLIVAQRTVVITPDVVSDYLVFRHGRYVPIVLNELKLGERIALGSNHDPYTVVVNSSLLSPRAIVVDVRIITPKQIEEWIPELSDH